MTDEERLQARADEMSAEERAAELLIEEKKRFVGLVCWTIVLVISLTQDMVFEGNVRVVIALSMAKVGVLVKLMQNEWSGAPLWMRILLIFLVVGALFTLTAEYATLRGYV